MLDWRTILECMKARPLRPEFEIFADLQALCAKPGYILGSFALPPGKRNLGINTLNDFNIVAATPLLRMPSGVRRAHPVL